MSETESESTRQPWTNHYLAVLPNATGAAILMLPSAQGWHLPQAHAEDIWLSDSSKLIPLLSSTLGLDFDFTILRYIATEMNEEERWDRTHFVLEPRQPVLDPPLDGQWVDHALLQQLPLAFPDQRGPLLYYLEENGLAANGQVDSSPLIDPRRAPWARPGWFAAASAWIEQAIVELGYTQTEPVQQLRNWSISSLLFAATSAGRVYFKAAAALPFFVNEPALTQTLAKLYPAHIPTPLKIDRDKRWMLMEDFNPTPQVDGPDDLASILHTYGEMQCASAEHFDELVAAGCIDRRLPVLATQIDALIADPVTKTAITAPEFDELVALAPYLKERCARVAGYNLPTTLLHGDLHLGNVTQRNGVPLFYDWTDAAIGFPFVDLFMLYFGDEENDVKEPIRGRDAYLGAWRSFESPARLLEVWELARPLCALHHAISYLTINNHIEPMTRAELFHGLPDNLHRLLASMRP